MNLLYFISALLAVFTVANASDFFIIGGNFSYAYNQDGSTVLANNIVVWDFQTETHKPLGMGTNGAVHKIHVDSCNNLWIGGDFTYVQGIFTGPVAFFNSKTNTWSSIGGTTWDSTVPNSVWSISSDCANVGICQCDVFIGGSFRLYDAQGANAYNVAKWIAGLNRWDDLGGYARSGINGYVNAVYKLEEGVTDRSKLLWVGGTFTGYFKVFSFKDRSWNSIKGLNGPVWAIQYRANIFSTDDIWLAGDFNTPSCSYVCHYNRKLDVLSQMGPALHPDSVVKALGVSNGMLYAVGNFVNFPLYRVARIPLGGAEHWESIPGSAQAVVSAPWDIAISHGNLGIAGPSGVVYYDMKTATWFRLGNGVAGVAQCIASLRL